MNSFVKSNEQSLVCLNYAAVASKSTSINQRLSETCNLLFVLSTSHNEVTNLEILIKSQKTDYNLYVDTANIFRRDNPFIVDNPMLHTFLVDNKNRKIVLVGNPLNNKEIHDMMLDIITKHNN